MKILNICLIQAGFSSYGLPKKDLSITKEVATEMKDKEHDKALAVQSIVFTITEDEETLAEMALKYMVIFCDFENESNKELEDSIFKEMQQVYIDKANEFLVPAHLPALYRPHLQDMINSED
ncbi:hypothetical protein [Treponema phagedenis]|uniref:hypothetical protein n=1 Tax=Treponema phagedenis TaxID=162 RepID=UPI0001F63BD4|nr:hypothetical protein [Treponema phagedenis]EFW38223.1 hypothetical protein HMPREF9554_01271 [Treponema phagedenis F0421]TYT78027.1 hypothetical protein FS559_02250 [Treponema phagedenis]